MPSRWFTGGRGLDHFRTSMLTDRRMRAIFDYVDSKDCFPTVDISGGVGYFLWDANHNADCTFTNTLHGKSLTRQRQLDEFPVFVRNNEALTLINKVLATSTNTLSSMVSGQTRLINSCSYLLKTSPTTAISNGRRQHRVLRLTQNQTLTLSTTSYMLNIALHQKKWQWLRASSNRCNIIRKAIAMT